MPLAPRPCSEPCPRDLASGLVIGSVVALVLVGALTIAPARAQPTDGASRRGFTVAVGVGAGGATLERPAAENLRESVVGSLDLAIGRFVTGTIAVGLGFTASTWSTQDAVAVSDFNTYDFGARAQWWVHPRWAVGLGVGALGIDDTDRDEVGRSGAALVVSLSYALVASDGQAHLLTLSWLEGRVDEEVVDGGEGLDHRVLTLLYRWQAW